MNKTDRLVWLAERAMVLDHNEQAELVRLAKEARDDLRSALKWRDQEASR